MRNIAFFESATPYWVDFHNSLSGAGFEIFYVFDSVYGYDQEALEKELDFRPHRLAKSSKNSWRLGELVSIIRKYRPEKVISIEFSLLTLQLVLARLITRVHYDLIVRTDDSYDLVRRHFSLKHTLGKKILLPHVGKLILCDYRTYGYYQDIAPGKGIYFPIVRDDDKFRQKLKAALPRTSELVLEFGLRDRKVILFVGRLSSEKNIGTLIRAYKKIRNDHTFCAIVGSGPLEGSLKALADGPDIHFAGKLVGENLYAWYNAADIFVLPSSRESFGAVVNEALLAGCQTLVSELAGSVPLVDGSNGASFNPADCSALAGLLSERLSAPVAGKDGIKENMMIESYDGYFNSFMELL